MKKYVLMVLMCIITAFSFVGCGEDVSSASIKSKYSNLVESGKMQIHVSTNLNETKNVCFSNPAKPNTISIYYSSTNLNTAINNELPESDTQKRYTALSYQQKILNNIYNFYENNQDEFYKNIDSQDVPKDKLEDLNNKINNLNNELNEFKRQYEIFVNAINVGLSDIMKSNMTRYTYSINCVIEESFDFMYTFMDIFMNYCIDDINDITDKNLNIKIDKAYVDLAYIIYLENFKAFNDSVGDVGICDVASVIRSESEYALINYLDDPKKLSSVVSSNLASTSPYYNENITKVNDFTYMLDVFEQRLDTYKFNLSGKDMYSIAQYKFNIYGVEYSSYLNTLSTSEKASVEMLDYFVKNNFRNLYEKLSLIV